MVTRLMIPYDTNKLTGKWVEGEEHKYVHDKDSKQENPQIAY